MPLGWKFLTFMLRTINNPFSLPTTPMVFCAHHWLITHIFIFVESCCYRKGFWSQGWNRLFRLLEKTKCTSNISLLIQKAALGFLSILVKLNQRPSLKWATRGKVFVWIKYIKDSLMTKENDCSFMCDHSEQQAEPALITTPHMQVLTF